MYKNAFILGGGAARGFAHIGILKAFYENDIKPDVIAGTSMGAIVGSLIAIGMSPEKIEEVVKKTNLLKMIDFNIGKAGLLEGSKVYEILKKYLGAITFEHLKKKSYDLIMHQQESRMLEKYPDVILLVPEMDEFDYANFLKKDEIMAKGYLEGKRLIRAYEL